MSTHEDIASRLEAAGFSNFSINYERGVAHVFFRGLPESFCVTEERCKEEKGKGEKTGSCNSSTIFR